MQKNNIAKRIEALVEYLNQGLYGQEEVIKKLLLFTLAKRKIKVSGNDEVLKNIICKRVRASFKEFYDDENFSLPCFGDDLPEILIPEIPEKDFLDFITNGNIELVPTEKQKNLLFTMDEVNKLQKEIKKIGLSDGVKQLILFNRKICTDTRWQDIIHVLQMSAFLNERDTVYLSDFSIFNSRLFTWPGNYRYICDFQFYNTINYVEYLKNKTNPERVRIPTSYGGMGVYEDKKIEINDRLIKDFDDYASENCSISGKENSAVKTIKETLDEKYSLALEDLEKRLHQIELFRSELNKPCIFKGEIGTFDLNAVTKNFEETKSALKSEYEKINFSFVEDIEIGDCICCNGDVQKPAGVSSDKIVAVICIKGDTANSLYGLSQEGWQEKTYEEAESIAESYSGKNNSVYSADWKIPTIEQLEQIYKNRETINSQKLGYNLSGKFWSSTKKDGEAVYFFDFDKGKKDYTTTDHKYNLALLHQFGD